ncbi:group II intron reverse transcriptase/maturase [Anaerotruncus colihominis]|uniref:Group II intron reverse transcriptase/maturase n=1 Tax=Anaerotruncus colihominis TaxID=169435 RepID=A0A845RJU9_9FIRM|nr:group II intron reverse transcriptase/maturase [Anaerotruncus colihominis]NBI79198.1 group II intron reverse transcriptase/maturase [Anaerotruncus colihominis]
MPVLTSEQQKRKAKRSKLRFAEYYDMQNAFDCLYAKSKENKVFMNLMEMITSEENIKLAYRTIKRNTGSKTPGTDGRTIDDLASMQEQQFVRLIKRQFQNYHPKPVKRVEIPKPNGKMRPLGIPVIIDRIVQQCILQIMEPICEAKFYEHSYGFRPNRSAENAISRCYNLIQCSHLHYVVDIDIQGFFDHVCHTKLIRQLWTMGIQDKKLLSIIKAMLKAPIQMPDGTLSHPDKGTPQGGILSPLLSNVVLNELDWWIASQWETMPTKYAYAIPLNPNGSEQRGCVYSALRRSSNLKEVHIVRYADDFKLFCSSRNDAKKLYAAASQWLKVRLRLDISPEKSKIVNLKKHYSEFLGFKMKVWKKGNKLVVRSHMCDKAKTALKERLEKCIKSIQHPQNQRTQNDAVYHYNSVVIGAQNYYRIATNVNLDFSQMAYVINRKLKNRIRKLSKTGELKPGFFKSRYGKSKAVRYLREIPLAPIAYVQHKHPMGKKRSVNRYTPEGRKEIHKSLSVNMHTLLWLMRHPVQDHSVEYADNRISLYAAQYGKCAVTGKVLPPYDIRCHHKIPLQYGGTDKYKNLIIVSEEVHILIHAVQQETILHYMEKLNLSEKQMAKLNELRTIALLPAIV